MSEKSNIAWTDSTAGPWLICTEVSTGCGHCYSRELMLSRLQYLARKAFKSAGFTDWETRPVWGDTAPRILTRDFRGKMLAMNRKPWIENHTGKGFSEAELSPGFNPQWYHRRRSFPSLIDWLDDMPAGMIDQDGNKLDPIAVLAEFLDTLRQCDQMTHILCTKRPENWRKRVEAAAEHVEAFYDADSSDPLLLMWLNQWLDHEPPANIILLASVENQEQADKRIPQLLAIPAACRGLSLEPLLGPVDLCLGSYYEAQEVREERGRLDISWVIVGGESGPDARPCRVDWIRSIVAQGKAAGVETFVKQLGSTSCAGREDSYILRHKKGGDPAEWPSDLRVQQFPKGF